jgi:hypothetical protein
MTTELETAAVLLGGCAARLERLSAELGQHRWQVAHAEATRVFAQGGDGCLRLRIDAELLLQSDAGRRRLGLALASAPWRQGDPWPPAAEPAAADAAVAEGPATVLPFSVLELSLGAAGDEPAGHWQRFLQPGAGLETPPAPRRAGAGRPIVEEVAAATARWLDETLAVTTVAGALAYLGAGPVGYYGPVMPRLLARSGQADLSVEATLLAEADAPAAEDAAPAARLALYGDRHGALLLHRCRLNPGSRKRTAGPPLEQYEAEVLTADSAETLMAEAGLGALEKRVFSAAGLLQPASLREHYLARAPAGEGPATLDLSTLAARPRQALEGIATLAAAGRLDASDLDLLLRTARRLARVVRR